MGRGTAKTYRHAAATVSYQTRRHRGYIWRKRRRFDKKSRAAREDFGDMDPFFSAITFTKKWSARHGSLADRKKCGRHFFSAAARRYDRRTDDGPAFGRTEYSSAIVGRT